VSWKSAPCPVFQTKTEEKKFFKSRAGNNIFCSHSAHFLMLCQKTTKLTPKMLEQYFALANYNNDEE
jgi:hypothetical protein